MFVAEHRCMLRGLRAPMPVTAQVLISRYRLHGDFADTPFTRSLRSMSSPGVDPDFAHWSGSGLIIVTRQCSH